MSGIGSWGQVNLMSIRSGGVHLKGKSGGQKREHEIALADKVKENPMRFYKYINGKRVTRERIGPLKINKVIYV